MRRIINICLFFYCKKVFKYFISLLNVLLFHSMLGYYYVNQGPKLNITDVRLANGTGPFDGRAEIKINDTWGTICDMNFNINDADTFCNMLGLK